jgi:hypothetical protein
MEFNEKLVGPVEITQNTIFYGEVDGDVFVKGGATLMFKGLITGSLTIEDKSYVDVVGQINKDVINKGILKIYGKVEGVILDPDKRATYNGKAIVENKKI